MWPALPGICYLRFFTGKGVAWGLAAGLTAVTVTYITELVTIGIGRYPLTLHSAGWGIIFNLLVTILVSALTQEDAETKTHRAHFTISLESTSFSRQKRKWKKPIWLLTLVWFLFAIGPLQSGYETNPANGSWGIPTAWVWQVAWWLIGCVMMYLLALNSKCPQCLRAKSHRSGRTTDRCNPPCRYLRTYTHLAGRRSATVCTPTRARRHGRLEFISTGLGHCRGWPPAVWSGVFVWHSFGALIALPLTFRSTCAPARSTHGCR